MAWIRRVAGVPMDAESTQRGEAQEPDGSTHVNTEHLHEKTGDLPTVHASLSLVQWASHDHFAREVKRLELRALEEILAQKALELATLQGELHAFEVQYLRRVGIYFAELDAIRAHIAEALVQCNVEDAHLQEEAARARTQARESAEASDAAGAARDAISAPFQPSAAIKILFRDLAKRLHPDLGSEEEDRLRRHQFMAEANTAYRGGDISRLHALRRAWDAYLQSVSTDVRTRFQHLLTQIFQVKARVRIMHATIQQLHHSDLSTLKKRVEDAAKHGEDVLATMAEQLQRDMLRERARLSAIVQGSV